MLKGIIHYAHDLIKQAVLPGETAIDATCGNGNDTLFLSSLVDETGTVLAFDIQKQAIINTTKMLRDHGRDNVTIIHDSHANITKYISPHNNKKIGGAIFNLGYLPKSDKAIITKGQTTIAAIDVILSLLKENGLIVLVVYHGHEGGESEKGIVLEYTMKLDQKKYHVLQYGFINQKNNPPFIIAIQKR